MSNTEIIKALETKLYETVEESKKDSENPRTKILNSSFNNGKIFGYLTAIKVISIEDYIRIYKTVNPHIESLLDINEGIYEL